MRNATVDRRGKERVSVVARPVTIANAEQMEFRSKVNGRRYSISVALPFAKPPERGFPVLYVLDGYCYFGSAVEAVRARSPEVVVVGIGYPDDSSYVESVLARHRPLPHWLTNEPPFNTAVTFERMYDLSLPASDEALAADLVPGFVLTGKDVGGLNDFLKTIEAEVKPRVASRTMIDRGNQAIFGHSLAGLAVVHALFVEPHAFRSFIAASPAIWWNRKAVLEQEGRFCEAVRAGTAAPRVLLTMGSEEGTPDAKVAAQLGMDFAQFGALLRKHRMVENARELTERLKTLRGSAEFEVEEYALFAKQDHGMSPWPALGRAVSFAFPQ